MKKYYRKLLFWFLFLLFLVTTPIAVLYSQGYRFDQKRMIFVHSGSITIKSLPSSISISLDGEVRPAKNLDLINNSVTIGGLKPGNYQLRLEADGYESWEKNVEVHSGLSTEFWNVVLAPKNIETLEVESENVSRFFPSPFGKKIAYSEDQENNLLIWITDFKKNEKQLLYNEPRASISSDQLENMEWNFKEDMILAPVLRDGGKRDYLVASTSGEYDPHYLSGIPGLTDIEKARWSPKEKNDVYFLAKEDGQKTDNLYRAVQDENKAQLIIPEITTYDLSQNSIYFLGKNNILMKSSLEGNSVEQVADNPLSDQPVGEKSRLIVYDENRQALVLENGDLFLHNDGAQNFFRKIAEGVQGIQFSDDGKKLLFWTNNEISVAFLRKWEVQPFRDENEIQTIIRVSSPLKNVFWYRDYEHIFLSMKNKIKIIELDLRDKRISSDVFENNLDDFPATYDIANGYYYFLTEKNNAKNISYFILPEETSFFD